MARSPSFIVAALAAACLMPAAALAAADVDLSAEKALVRSTARASSGGGFRVPLPLPPLARSAGAIASEGSLAAKPGPLRVLVPVRTHGAVDGVAALARRVGSRVRVLRSIAVVAVTLEDPAADVPALSRDPRVVRVEPNTVYESKFEPADGNDPDTGIPYNWAFVVVRAEAAIAAVGGGSRFPIAVIDSGIDTTHPDIDARIVGQFDANTGAQQIQDRVGHGTFTTGTIAMEDGNEFGGRGVGGTTPILGVLAEQPSGGFSAENLDVGIEWAIQNGARVLNLSLGGEGIPESVARSLTGAFFSDALPVAAAGNEAQDGNPIGFPAALLGGEQGARGIGLSVGATGPTGEREPFSTFNDFVSLAAPGGFGGSCPKGVFSTIPTNQSELFSDPNYCFHLYEGGFGYAQGTSFSAPIVSGLSALAWEAEPRLASEQVADVLTRSARQPDGSHTWNQETGWGIADGQGAVAEAQVYDVVDPTMKASAKRRKRNRVKISVSRLADHTDPGDQLAGAVFARVFEQRGSDFAPVAGPKSDSISKTIKVKRKRILFAIACDANGNCAVKKLGTFRPRR